MAAKIRFKVVKCSSSDNGYEATELENRSSTTKTKGWQSIRFPEYPQKIVLKLQGGIHDVRKLQVLAHESKIPTSMEVFCGNRAKDAIVWERLGYLSLDDNQRSQFKARELKSVYVNARGEYIKFIIKQCHINTINLFNQVGIVAINVVGTSSKVTGANDLDSGLDPRTSDRIQDLQRRKDAALHREDYEEAKRIKAAVERLQNIADKIAALERKKAHAVANEDYDLAKAFKDEIDLLRDGPKPPSRRGSRAMSPNTRAPKQIERPASRRRPSVMEQREEPQLDALDPMERPLAAASRRPEPVIEDYEDNIKNSSSPKNGDDRPIKPAAKADPDFGGANDPGDDGATLEPEPISSADQKLGDELMNVFDAHTVKCFLSGKWGLREQAVHKITEDIEGNFIQKEPPIVFSALCHVLERGVTDRVAKVFAASLPLVKLTLDRYGKIESGEKQKSSLFLTVDGLVEGLANSNARCRQQASELLNFLACHKDVVRDFVTFRITRPLKKSDAGKPLPLKGRANCLQQLVEGKGSYSFDDVLNFLTPHVDHRDKAVRDAMVELAVALRRRDSKKVMSAIETIDPAKRDILVAKLSGDVKSPGKGTQEPKASVKKDSNKKGKKGKDGSSAKKNSRKEEEESLQNFCQFCGLQDENFSEEKLDLHYWQDCVMLTNCQQCEQVIEVPTLNDHILDECEKTGTHSECPQCKEPIPNVDFPLHKKAKKCKPAQPPHKNNRCPLCHNDIPPGEDGWKVHLIDKGCPKNPRKHKGS